MASQEHLDVLRQGMTIWNQWREEHLGLQPDLSEADLSSTILREIDLTGANLKLAHLNGIDLNRANLRGAYLDGASLNEAYVVDANLFRASLTEVDLTKAILNESDLRWTNLSMANLSEAELYGVNFSDALLEDADFSKAHIGTYAMPMAAFGNVDLRFVKGLDTVVHHGPSIIGIDTIYRSQGKIPETFLRGAGISEEFITYVRTLVGQHVGYFKCFISYASRDQAFAEQLFA